MSSDVDLVTVQYCLSDVKCVLSFVDCVLVTINVSMMMMILCFSITAMIIIKVLFN